MYAKANVPATEEVYLWLGANVMLAYPIPEAETLLESKLGSAKTSMANCEEDLDFLREQITVRRRTLCVLLSWTRRRLIQTVSRLWKLRLHASTTGTSPSGGRRKPKAAPQTTGTSQSGRFLEDGHG